MFAPAEVLRPITYLYIVLRKALNLFHLFTKLVCGEELIEMLIF